MPASSEWPPVSGLDEPEVLSDLLPSIVPPSQPGDVPSSSLLVRLALDDVVLVGEFSSSLNIELS